MLRSRNIPLVLGSLALLSICAWGQLETDDPPAVPLGDVARSMRKTAPPVAPQTVIDNDNFDKVLEEVEGHRVSSTLLFSFGPDGKTFRVSPTPDVTCSLSFNAQSTALISDPYVSREMPSEEVAKLSGPATIEGDRLQIEVFNGSTWRLDEITVGLTIVRRTSTAAGYYGTGRLVPAAAQSIEIARKAPDTTTLYKMRAAAAPAVITIFKTGLSTPPGPDAEWHWAIVQAKGIPPRPGTIEATSQPASIQ
jgi:hypothetical protein